MHRRRVFVIEHSGVEGIQAGIEEVDGDEDGVGAPGGPHINVVRFDILC